MQIVSVAIVFSSECVFRVVLLRIMPSTFQETAVIHPKADGREQPH
jgi:hypothetical protein